METDTVMARFRSPLGWMEISACEGAIIRIGFTDQDGDIPPATGLLRIGIDQLEAYFAGTLKSFDLPLAPRGTPFQLKVWDELQRIPHGQVMTYGDLARRLGGSTFTRIVGQANARNPIAVVIPCHRIVGQNGALTGYAGGLWRKQFLLNLEAEAGAPGFTPTLF